MSNDVKIFGGIIGATILLIVGAVFFMGGKGETKGASTSQETKIVPIEALVKEDSWAIGTPSAKVSVVEFGDFQCPSCKVEEPIVQELLKHYGNKIFFVYRHFPLTQIHNYALEAGTAAEAAGMQGKFWEYHAKLYKISPDLQKDNLLKIAKELNLDENKFATDLAGDAARQKVLNDMADGNKFGVNSTPTFFINGKILESPTLPTLANFQSEIDPLLK